MLNKLFPQRKTKVLPCNSILSWKARLRYILNAFGSICKQPKRAITCHNCAISFGSRFLSSCISKWILAKKKQDKYVRYFTLFREIKAFSINAQIYHFLSELCIIYSASHCKYKSFRIFLIFLPLKYYHSKYQNIEIQKIVFPSIIGFC